MNLKVYTVGAISGLDYESCVRQFEPRIAKLREIGYDVFYPMLGKGYLRNELALRAEGYPDMPLSCNHAIVQADFWRVDSSDILFVDLTNATERVSIGSVSEMSRGFAKGKLIITVMQKVNVHRHAFVIEMSSIIFETLEEAYAYLGEYRETLQKPHIGTAFDKTYK